MYFAKTAQKLREQMVRFSGELSAGLPKVARRFVAEMIFGIQARGSVRLTEVGRALGERISLKKTEERLSRQLGRRGLDRELERRLIEHAAPRIEEDTLLVLDLSDVTKKYAAAPESGGLFRGRAGGPRPLPPRGTPGPGAAPDRVPDEDVRDRTAQALRRLRLGLQPQDPQG